MRGQNKGYLLIQETFLLRVMFKKITSNNFKLYIAGEPICKSISDQFHGVFRSPAWEKELMDYVHEGVSIIAVEKETNTLVGFNISSVIDLQR